MRIIQRGFTFIEVLTVLSIIAVSTLGVLKMRDWALSNARVGEAKALIATAQAGVQLWQPQRGLYDGVTTQALSAIAAVPTHWLDGTAMNPWGGAIDISADSADSTRYIIRLTGITRASEGARLAHDLAQTAVVASFTGSTLSATFQG
ncbi:type II secretion system protein [Idiomarina xiamenensis]|uniref:Prepilin-type N-terminal cleavage/methylation domain-containing protein n=1 Tax=Idiomarina xiamenensis 10-D-4 TaxID=740709 RepID=K2KMZ1_9GAMM|nr:type II secretion system protein [Idiomarina xiamenensis]EKE83824.1 hypothetical protein A10D4_06751 [Idiomarina xiamenensis 10-D-4]